MLDKIELIYFGCIFFGNIMIAHQFAKHGFLEFGLVKSPKAVLGFIVGVSAIFLGGIYHKFNPAFDPEPTLKLVLILIGIPVFWIIVLRYVLMPKGQFDYNRARVRLNFWMQRNLVLGEVLAKEGARLKDFPRAQDTIRLFKRAIQIQSHGVSRRTFEQSIELDEERRSYDYGYLFSCPVCGNEISYPDYEGQVLTANCNICQSVIHGRKKGNKLHMSVMATKGNRKVTDANRHNIAVAYGEMGQLYRIMNMFGESRKAFETSLDKVGELLIKHPNNDSYLATKSLSTFRLAEVNQVSNHPEIARELYNDCLKIDKQLCDNNGIQAILGMLKKLDQKTVHQE